MEPHSQAQRRHDPEEISLHDLLDSLWQRRLLIACVTVVFALLATAAAWLTPKTYKAAVVVSPVSNTAGGSQLGGLSSLVSQFGGLASLAGISVGADSKKTESVAVLQSEALTAAYIRTNDLLPLLYAKKWDAQAHKWREDSPEEVPTLWQANQFFKKKIRKVATDAKTGLVTLTITWKDPLIAAKWANDLVKVTNDYLRNEAIAESERNIAYLTDQATKTNIVEARQAIYSVLQTELNKMMLARGSEQFAFKIIDPAVAPERPAAPQKLVWVLAGILAGLFSAAAAVLFRAAWLRSR